MLKPGARRMKGSELAVALLLRSGVNAKGATVRALSLRSRIYGGHDSAIRGSRLRYECFVFNSTLSLLSLSLILENTAKSHSYRDFVCAAVERIGHSQDKNPVPTFR